MKKVLIVILILAGCTSKDKYDVTRYYDAKQQNQVLTSLVTFIFDAPPLTPMSDRFKPEHRNFYSFTASRFSIEKYFIAEDGTHYFYVIRPAPSPQEKRGVGGHFRMKDGYQLTEFSEVFVTPILPEADVKGRCAFLFDEMVKGTIDKYLTMESYVQWPNPASYYDSTTYEWKLKPNSEH